MAALQRIEIAADRYRHKLLSAEYENRDKVLDAMPGFWLTALKHSITFLQLAAIEDDTKALQFVTKVKAWRDPDQPQAFSFEFVRRLVLGSDRSHLLSLRWLTLGKLSPAF